MLNSSIFDTSQSASCTPSPRWPPLPTDPYPSDPGPEPTSYPPLRPRSRTPESPESPFEFSETENQPTTPWLTKPSPFQDARSPDSLSPTKQRADVLRRSRPDAPVQERSYPPKPLHWDDLSRSERADWYAENGTTIDQPTKQKSTYREPTPAFWEDLSDNGQARWTHRHRDLVPAPGRSSRSPDDTSARSTIESTNSITPGNLTPIPQNQLAATTQAPQRPTPGSSYETQSDPKRLLTELPPIHDCATHAHDVPLALQTN